MAGRPDAALTIGRVIRQDGDDLIEGVLLCPARECQREHPVIDGIPIIVADIRAQIAGQLGQIRAREDLSPVMDSLLGDCAGPGSEFDRERYHLSTYARGHYGDLDPENPLDGSPASTLLPLLERSLGMLSAPPSGVWLDVGCSVGRASFELAARSDALILGLDLNLGMLRMARRIARTGQVAHALRRVGIVYDHREFSVGFAGAESVDFWACDAMALPFAAGSCDGLLSFNVVDCVSSPVAHLMELGRVLRPGAEAVITTPYDWSVNATPIEGWIGGHSQRTESQGSSVAEMQRLLSERAPPEIWPRMTIVREVERFPWHVYVHERASMIYQVHLLIARAQAAASD
jgi:SAM-dependent methyltransferase